MAVAADDHAVYVADGGAGHVVKVGRSGCQTIGSDALERPTGVAVVRNRLFVVDPPKHRVIAFTTAGEYLFEFGHRGSATTKGLNFPTAVSATGDGELLVVDALNFRISRFTTSGAYLDSFGSAGDRGGEFGRPKSVAQGSDGRIYVTDAHHDVVIVFAEAGGFEVAVGGHGDGPGELAMPAGVAVAGEFMFVADSFNRRVQIYQLLTATP